MIDHLLYILWNPDLEIFRIGNFAIRWYSTCWLIGLALAYFIVKWLYKDQKVKDAYFDPLFMYCFLGILIGARLGHCLFYQPEYFLSSWTHVVEMFLPIHQMADGSWKFTGYEGLASHGGTIGLMVALYLYYRKTGMNLWHVLDDIAIATPITACFIRLGNLMNSEIIGTPTNVPWAFIFERVDMTPRHPGQLYEAIAYFFFFFVMLHFYKRTSKEVGTGFYFGLCLTLIFTFRFFIEYTKDIQVDFESGMIFNMGQLLSIPFIILGIACMRGGKWMKKLGAK
ncbi:prolipoprotein diacylglyceryl transferase [Prevotella sp. TCVGH]|uniref:Phosphatidylglycerol--prolipoprotein diacylglyceryl transferase n=1 Tax=Hoylesella timonensis S9-PR14 TaxID=1401062 RepID=A0A098YPQ6_9BACT|nr:MULTISPECIES: prolipoprotein diacylglyceryl transferase [Prevotellaceae]KGI21299.1 diacylglyceryl transferase [Hoylesella timonensis S9-PR14]MCL6749094.1 prolipoprotein diacylglyceryl transferase [Prevotella sp. TCVGH]